MTGPGSSAGGTVTIKDSWEGTKEPDDAALQTTLCKYFLDHWNKRGSLRFSSEMSR